MELKQELCFYSCNSPPWASSLLRSIKTSLRSKAAKSRIEYKYILCYHRDIWTPKNYQSVYSWVSRFPLLLRSIVRHCSPVSRESMCGSYLPRTCTSRSLPHGIPQMKGRSFNGCKTLFVIQNRFHLLSIVLPVARIMIVRNCSGLNVRQVPSSLHWSEYLQMLLIYRNIGHSFPISLLPDVLKTIKSDPCRTT